LAGVLLAALVGAAGCTGDSDAGNPGSGEPTAQPTAEPFVWGTTPPRAAGLDPARLEEIAADARRDGTTCMLVVRDGRIAAEWYWGDGAEDVRLPAFSITKSVTSTLVGMAQADGDLDVDDPASLFIDEWRGTRSEKVTVRNLLSNDSGRFWTFRSDYKKLPFSTDRTGYAIGLGQAARPGAVWRYNNAAIQTLERVLTVATGTDAGSYAADRLLGPLGMADSRMTRDEAGSVATAFGLETTCRDLARFGLLFAQQGTWQGEQLVPRAWVRSATSRASQDLNPRYGLLWWVNASGTLTPGVARSAYAAIGFGGQVLLVDPSTDTIVVRLGTPGPDYTVVDAARVVTEALRPAR
jgi:CubicO group peptidase (beta-lactamase class C family)